MTCALLLSPSIQAAPVGGRRAAWSSLDWAIVASILPCRGAGAGRAKAQPCMPPLPPGIGGIGGIDGIDGIDGGG
jgi:hypothetical protein